MAWDWGRAATPVSADAPHGPYLESDARWKALDVRLKSARAAMKAHRLNSTERPPARGELLAAIKEVEGLVAETHDLRGFAGLIQLYALVGDLSSVAGCLTATVQLVTEDWRDIHPSPAEPRKRLAEKERALSQLSETYGFSFPVGLATLTCVAGELSYKVSDLLADPPSSGLIAAIKAADRAVVEDEHRVLRTIVQALEQLQASAEAAIEADPAGGPKFLKPTFAGVLETLAKLPQVLAEQAGLAGGGQATSVDDRKATKRGATWIRGRPDVLVALDAIVDFYRQAEPGSPTPVLVARARQLVGGGFQTVVEALSATPELSALTKDVNLDPAAAVEVSDAAAGVRAALSEEVEPLRTLAGRMPTNGETSDDLAEIATALTALADRLSALASVDKETMAAAPVAAPMTPTAPPTVASRTDVVGVIDDVIGYYDRFEPSSPTPLLLKKAQDLVGKDFWETVKTLAPKGYKEIGKMLGHATENVE